MENGHEIVSFPMKNGDFSIAMLVYQRVHEDHEAIGQDESLSRAKAS